MDGPHDFPRRYVTPEEFARTTGLSLTTVRRRLAKGDLPARQPGGPRTRWLIDLQAFVAEQDSALRDPPASHQAPPEAAEEPEAPGPPDAARPAGPQPRWMAVYPQSAS